MKSFEDIVENRRSWRAFDGKSVEESAIKKIIKAGYHAPTPLDIRNFKSVVIKDKEIIAKVSEMDEWSAFVKNAGVVIILLETEIKDFSWAESKEDNEIYKEIGGKLSVQGLSNNMMSMLLMAEDLGLGACWVGVHPIKESQDYLSEILKSVNVDAGVPFGILALGNKLEYELEEKNIDFDYIEVEGEEVNVK